MQTDTNVLSKSVGSEHCTRPDYKTVKENYPQWKHCREIHLINKLRRCQVLFFQDTWRYSLNSIIQIFNFYGENSGQCAH